MEVRISRIFPDCFRPGLTIEQAYDMHARFITAATSSAEYNAAVSKALLCLNWACLSNQKRCIAITFLAKHGDDALKPLWAVPHFEHQRFTSKERDFFHLHWPTQFALTPQGAQMTLTAMKRLKPESILARKSESKRHCTDVVHLSKIDCRAVRHVHSAKLLLKLPRPASTDPGFEFYMYETVRAALVRERQVIMALFAWLGARRTKRLFLGSFPMGSYAPAGRALLAFLGYRRDRGFLECKAKQPRGYVPYGGCACEAYLSDA